MIIIIIYALCISHHFFYFLVSSIFHRSACCHPCYFHAKKRSRNEREENCLRVLDILSLSLSPPYSLTHCHGKASCFYSDEKDKSVIGFVSFLHFKYIYDSSVTSRRTSKQVRKKKHKEDEEKWFGNVISRNLPLHHFSCHVTTLSTFVSVVSISIDMDILGKNVNKIYVYLRYTVYMSAI